MAPLASILGSDKKDQAVFKPCCLVKQLKQKWFSKDYTWMKPAEMADSHEIT